MSNKHLNPSLNILQKYIVDELYQYKLFNFVCTSQSANADEAIQSSREQWFWIYSTYIVQEYHNTIIAVRYL